MKETTTLTSSATTPSTSASSPPPQSKVNTSDNKLESKQPLQQVTDHNSKTSKELISNTNNNNNNNNNYNFDNNNSPQGKEAKMAANSFTAKQSNQAGIQTGNSNQSPQTYQTYQPHANNNGNSLGHYNQQHSNSRYNSAGGSSLSSYVARNPSNQNTRGHNHNNHQSNNHHHNHHHHYNHHNHQPHHHQQHHHNHQAHHLHQHHHPSSNNSNHLSTNYHNTNYQSHNHGQKHAVESACESAPATGGQELASATGSVSAGGGISTMSQLRRLPGDQQLASNESTAPAGSQLGAASGPPYYVDLHVNVGECVSLQLLDGQEQVIAGPATVKMVSQQQNPPVAIPVLVPPGHMIHQIADENGTLKHIILSVVDPTLDDPTGSGQLEPTVISLPQGNFRVDSHGELVSAGEQSLVRMGSLAHQQQHPAYYADYNGCPIAYESGPAAVDGSTGNGMPVVQALAAEQPLPVSSAAGAAAGALPVPGAQVYPGGAPSSVESQPAQYSQQAHHHRHHHHQHHQHHFHAPADAYMNHHQPHHHHHHHHHQPHFHASSQAPYSEVVSAAAGSSMLGSGRPLPAGASGNQASHQHHHQPHHQHHSHHNHHGNKHASNHHHYQNSLAGLELAAGQKQLPNLADLTSYPAMGSSGLQQTVKGPSDIHAQQSRRAAREHPAVSYAAAGARPPGPPPTRADTPRRQAPEGAAKPAQQQNASPAGRPKVIANSPQGKQQPPQQQHSSPSRGPRPKTAGSRQPRHSSQEAASLSARAQSKHNKSPARPPKPHNQATSANKNSSPVLESGQQDSFEAQLGAAPDGGQHRPAPQKGAGSKSSPAAPKNAANDSGIADSSKPPSPLTPVKSSPAVKHSSSEELATPPEEAQAGDSFDLEPKKAPANSDVPFVDKSQRVAAKHTKMNPLEASTPEAEERQPVEEPTPEGASEEPTPTGRPSQKKCQAGQQQASNMKSQSFADAQSFAKSHQKKAELAGHTPGAAREPTGAKTARARSVENNLHQASQPSLQPGKGKATEKQASSKSNNNKHAAAKSAELQAKPQNSKKSAKSTRESNLNAEQAHTSGGASRNPKHNHQHESLSTAGSGPSWSQSNSNGSGGSSSSASAAPSLSNDRGNSSSQGHHHHHQQSGKQQPPVKLASLVRQCKGKLANVLSRVVQNSLASYNNTKFAGLLIILFTMFAMLLAVFIHLYIVAPVAEL